MMFSNLQGEFDTRGRIRRCVIEAGAATLALEVMVSAFPLRGSQTAPPEFVSGSQKGDRRRVIFFFFFFVYQVQTCI